MNRSMVVVWRKSLEVFTLALLLLFDGTSPTLHGSPTADSYLFLVGEPTVLFDLSESHGIVLPDFPPSARAAFWIDAENTLITVNHEGTVTRYQPNNTPQEILQLQGMGNVWSISPDGEVLLLSWFDTNETRTEDDDTVQIGLLGLETEVFTPLTDSIPIQFNVPYRASWSQAANRIAYDLVNPFASSIYYMNLACLEADTCETAKQIIVTVEEGEPLNLRSPAWSPEGNQLAFVCETTICVADVSEESAVLTERLHMEPPGITLIWIGDALYYLRGNNLYSYDFSQEHEQQLAEFEAQEFYFISGISNEGAHHLVEMFGES